MKKEATITSKGQLTIPVEIRRELKLQPGDKVRFEIEGDRAIMKPIRKQDLMDLYQSVAVPEGKTKDLYTIRKTIQKEIGRRAAEEGS